MQRDYMGLKKPMIALSEVQQEQYDASMRCMECFRPYTAANYKVRDHDHITGAYR